MSYNPNRYLCSCTSDESAWPHFFYSYLFDVGLKEESRRCWKGRDWRDKEKKENKRSAYIYTVKCWPNVLPGFPSLSFSTGCRERPDVRSTQRQLCLGLFFLFSFGFFIPTLRVRAVTNHGGKIPPTWESEKQREVNERIYIYIRTNCSIRWDSAANDDQDKSWNKSCGYCRSCPTSVSRIGIYGVARPTRNALERENGKLSIAGSQKKRQKAKQNKKNRRGNLVYYIPKRDRPDDCRCRRKRNDAPEFQTRNSTFLFYFSPIIIIYGGKISPCDVKLFGSYSK